MSQGKVNIPRSIQDPEYRYKMPLLQQRIIGRGINVRTEFLNLKEVAKALFIEPEYILKFMGQEFGSKSTLKRDKQTNEIQVTSINGKFADEDILLTLDRFIEKFILCQKDKIPEMRLFVEKGQVLGKCNACGHISKIDPTHKLTAYIQKHPPKQISDIQGAGDQIDEEDQIQLKEQATKFQKYKIRDLLKESDLDPKNEDNQELFEKIWKYLSQILTIDEDYSYEDMQTFDLYKAVKRLRMKKEYYDKVGFIVFNFIFDEKIFTQIESRAILFEQFLIKHRLGDFICQETALNLTFFCFSIHKDKNWDKFLPTMVKKFLDQDLFKKEFLLKWEAKDEQIMNFFKLHCLYNEENNDKILKICEPFFNWLKAESEDEESEEESDEDESGEDEN